MSPAPASKVRTALVVKTDRLYAQALVEHVQRIFPATEVHHVPSADTASQFIAAKPVDLLVCDLASGAEGDVLEILLNYAEHNAAPRMLVVTTSSEIRALGVLRALDINGAFDSAMEAPEAFSDALRMVAAGGRYWSPSILRRLKEGGDATVCLRCLTTLEQLVLSAIGDGTDDPTAAIALSLSPSTVSTVRRDLHRKLGVQHRGELVKIAAQLGFVRFTSAGVIRPGFTSSLAAYHARRHRRTVAAQSCGGCDIAA